MTGLWPDEPPTMTTCPACKGSTFESIEDQHDGTYRVRQCGWCGGNGVVTAARAAEFRARLTSSTR